MNSNIEEMPQTAVVLAQWYGLNQDEQQKAVIVGPLSVFTSEVIQSLPVGTQVVITDFKNYPAIACLR